MYGFLHNFKLWLFVNFWNNLLNFEHFANLFVNIFRNFFFILYLFSLYLGCMIWNLEFSFNLLWYEYLFLRLYWNLLNNLNIFLLINWHFYYINFIFVFDHLFNNPCLDSIRFFDGDWNLYNFAFTILIRDFFPIWNSLLEIDCEVGGIGNYHSFLLFEWYSDSLRRRNEDGFVDKNINLTYSSVGPKESNNIVGIDSIESLCFKQFENALVQWNTNFVVVVDSLQFINQGFDQNLQVIYGLFVSFTVIVVDIINVDYLCFFD